MKISVVIPAYNEEQYIEQCFQSLQKQIRKPDELIVVDNNSTDKTADIAKKYKATMIVEKRKGISYARNAGFNAATGDIIARCDADTIIPPDWLFRIEKTMENPRVDAVTGALRFYEKPFLSTFLGSCYMYIVYLIQGFYTLNGFNMAIRNSVWKKVYQYTAHDDDGVQEDNDLAIVIALHGGNIRYFPNLVVLVSARRLMKNPKSFFLNYPKRYYHTLHRHWREMIHHRQTHLFS